jgi:hypothetical protein
MFMVGRTASWRFSVSDEPNSGLFFRMPNLHAFLLQEERVKG